MHEEIFKLIYLVLNNYIHVTHVTVANEKVSLNVF